ncbi:unnamed protein product [Rhodiola kirilowii]
MARMMIMMMLFMMVAIMVAAPAAYAASYTVGDGSGWDTGISYSDWVGSKTFTVGDTLVFNYELNHAVDQVSATDYESCSSASPIKSYSGGTTTVTLSTTGSWYFICPTPGHCTNKQALSITVTEETTPSPPDSTTASPPPPTTETTTSPPPPSTATSSPPPPAGKAGGLVVSGLSSLVGVLVVFLMSVSL